MSLVLLTSQCRKMELIESSERRVCSCAKLQNVSCYKGWKEACQATRAISTTLGRELSSSLHNNSPLQGKALKEIQAILTETLGEHAPTYAIVKNWMAWVKRLDFFTCDAPRPGRPKTVTTPEIIYQIHELISEDRQISAKSIAEQLGISREWIGTIIHEDLDMQKLSAKWVRNAWTRTKHDNGASRLRKFGIFSVWFKWFPVALGDHGRNLVISLWHGDKATINWVEA